AMVSSAVDAAPAARATMLDTAAAEARITAAGAWLPTQLRGGTNRITAQEVIGITLPLPILGTIGAARGEAAAHAEVVRDESAVAKRDLRRRAAAAWLELARSDTEITTFVTAAAQAKELERIAQGRLDAGTGGEVDVTSAHAASARADVAVAAQRRESLARGAELAGILAWDLGRERHAAGDLPGGSADLATLRATLVRHPERAEALARVAEGEATRHRLEVLYRPMLAIEASASFNDPTNNNRTDAYGGLVLEFPLFGHIGNQVTAAERDLAASRLRLGAVESELAGRLVAAYQRWQAASERVSALDRDVMPAQQRAAQQAQQAFREGARDLSTALQASRDLTSVAGELANARIDAAQAWIDLVLAAGGDDAH
ncbi:MAG TPA: TolC family protein, partial [Kofleriaceae bacterium]|nr:TolC family protein [Kofleriaceae bacterium]